MKRFISLILFLMLVFIVIGCFATMTPEQRKETYDLRGSVGNAPFGGGGIGGGRPMDGHGNPIPLY